MLMLARIDHGSCIVSVRSSVLKLAWDLVCAVKTSKLVGLSIDSKCCTAQNNCRDVGSYSHVHQFTVVNITNKSITKCELFIEVWTTQCSKSL